MTCTGIPTGQNLRRLDSRVTPQIHRTTSCSVNPMATYRGVLPNPLSAKPADMRRLTLALYSDPKFSAKDGGVYIFYLLYSKFRNVGVLGCLLEDRNPIQTPEYRHCYESSLAPVSAHFHGTTTSALIVVEKKSKRSPIITYMFGRLVVKHTGTAALGSTS